jgi:hypothetical protein
MMPRKDGIDKDMGSSYAWLALWVGVGLVVFGVIYAVVAHLRIQDPFWIAVVVMVLAVMGYFTLVAMWFLVRTFKTLNVLLLAISGALFVYFCLRSVIIPLFAPVPGEAFGRVLLRALTDSPVAELLVVTIVLAAALVKKAKP